MFVHRNNCCCQKKRGSYVGIENIRGKSFLEQSKSGKAAVPVPAVQSVVSNRPFGNKK